MFTSIIDYFIHLADIYGLYGIALGMGLESLGVPFAGIAMALAVVPMVEQGRATYTGIIAVATVGTVMGSIISYYIGYFFGEIIRKFHKGHLINREELLVKFVDRYGEGAVFFAQLFGFSRSFISLPSGVVRMKLKNFIIGTIAGSLVINTAMVVADIYLYKTWRDISNYLGVPMWTSMVVSGIFIVAIITLYKIKIKDLMNGNNKHRKVQKS